MTKYYFSLILLSFALSVSFLSAQTTYFVDANNGSDANNGLRKSIAFQNINTALNAANDGDIIQLAAGLYNEQLNIGKRITLIGSGSGNTAQTASLIQVATGQVINLTAPELGDSKVTLKNLAVIASGNGSAITINTSNVSLDELRVKGTSQRGIQINSSVNNINVNRCEIYGSAIGLLVNDNIDVNELEIRNCNFYNNSNHAISFRESNSTIAGIVNNVVIKNCLFKDNNLNNVNLGHTIYLEKLSNAIFQDISIYMPLSNVQNAIDVNLKWRTDYENIVFRNILINRETEGVGIFVKGRDDAPLYDAVPASVANVSIFTSRFNGCRNNIRFENNVNGITVERCDLSNFNAQQGNGIVNLTTSFSAVNADNNFFGTQNPVVSLGYAASTENGNPDITLLPLFNSTELAIGMFVFGQNIPFGTFVAGVNGQTITLSNPVSATAAQDAFLFSTSLFPAAHVQRASTNPLSIENPLEYRLVNNLNQSFNDLQTAINTSPIGATLYHVEPTTYPGGIVIDKNLTLSTAGAGVLDANTVPLFDNLIIESGTLTLGLDIEVVNQIILDGSLNLNERQLNLLGKVVGVGETIVDEFATISIAGGDSVGTFRFQQNSAALGRLIYDRGNEGVLNIASDLQINELSLVAGIIKLADDKILSVNNPEARLINPNAFVIGNLAYQIASENTTFDLSFPTGGSLYGRRDFHLSFKQDNASANYYMAKIIEQPSADLALELPDGINRVSPVRYWLLTMGDNAEIIDAEATIYYQDGDLVVDEINENLKMLKENTEAEAIWENIGGNASAPIQGSISSSAQFTTLGYFTLGNVTGGDNFLPDTIYVDALNGNDAYNGLSPVFVGDNEGPKLTFNAGVQTVVSSGVLVVASGNYQERVLFNKRITLMSSGSDAVVVDTLVIQNGVNLLPNLPAETDFAVNTVDLETGAKLSDGFLLVAEEGVVYLRDAFYDENVSTNKSFIIKGLGESTVQTINLNGNGNILTIGTPFIVGQTLNLNAATGSKVRINNDNLTVNNLEQITGVSSQSYIITDGTGYVVLNNLTDIAAKFPVGTTLHFAPVTIDDENNTGDRVGARVKFAANTNDFNPELPFLITSFVQLQWSLFEEVEGGNNASLTFEYNPLVQVLNFDLLPEKLIATNTGVGEWTGVEPVEAPNQLSASNYVNLNGNYALYSTFTVSVKDLSNQSLAVFPNPFKNNLTISTAQALNGTISLSDITGRVIESQVIKQSAAGNLELNINQELKSGIYFLTLLEGNNQQTFKLIKQ